MPSRYRFNAATFAAIALIVGCKTTRIGDRDEGSLCVAISVDWEGASLEDADLAALEELERLFPNVPLTHFLNAAYFVRPGADPDEVKSAIARVVRPIDERGLHVHAWHALVEASGVTPKRGRSFLGSEPMSIDGEEGFDIELETYASEELEAIMRRSLALLGMTSAKSFRAGAWLAGPRVHEAARRAGFEIDSSAAYADWFDEFADRPLPSRLKEVWPELKAHTQPYPITTPAGAIMEMPLTGGMADFATAEEIAGHVTAMLDRARAENRPMFVQTGLHQEGAADYSMRIAEAIRRIEEVGKDSVRFDTVAGCAARMVWE